MTTPKHRVRWHRNGESVICTLAGRQVAELMPSPIPEQWIVSEETIRTLPAMYGHGPQSLSTWKRRVSAVARQIAARA